MDEKQEKIKKFIENIPDTFDIVEEGIDIQTQKEYLEYSHSFDCGKLTDKETQKLSDILFLSSTGVTDKKKALTLLAHLGTITAYRQIEKFYQDTGSELKKWTALALQECRMFLESTLTDESMGFMMSGLGGYKDKLRYYLLVLSSSDQSFSQTQNKIIKNEFKDVAKDNNCIVETVDFSSNFVAMTVLIPMDIAVGTFIETGIQKCNEFGNFVFEYYFVTNGDIPEESEIEDIIKKVKE